jgi:hypothetical protein
MVLKEDVYLIKHLHLSNYKFYLHIKSFLQMNHKLVIHNQINSNLNIALILYHLKNQVIFKVIQYILYM